VARAFLEVDRGSVTLGQRGHSPRVEAEMARATR